MRLKNFLIVSVLFFIVFFLSLMVWVNFNGKAYIEKRASVLLQRSVTVEKVRLVLPGAVILNDLNVEGLLWAAEVKVHCHPWALLGRDIDLGNVELMNPILTLHRTKDRQIVWAAHEEGVSNTPKNVSIKKPTMRHARAVINVLSVVNGRIYLPSHSSDENGSEFSLSQVEIKAHNVPLSGQERDVDFHFLGKIEGRDIPLAQDSLKGSGWINWQGRHMDATFTVVNPQGKIDVEINLNAKNNDLMVHGRLKTRRMHLKSNTENESSMEYVLLDAIESAGMEIDLEFSLLTKMDQWELRNIDFSGNLNASNEGKTPAEKMEALKNIGQQFKAVGEQLYEKYNPEKK